MKKRKGFIAPHALIKTRDFIIVMGFPGLVQIQGLDYWNINALCHNFLVDCCVCLPSILYFALWACFVLVLFLFYWSLPVIYHCMLLLIVLSCIVFVDCFNACDDRQLRQLTCTGHLHEYNRQLKKGMIWCKKTPYFWLNPLIPITYKSLFLKRNSCFCHSMFTFMVDFSLILSTYTNLLSRARSVNF